MPICYLTGQNEFRHEFNSCNTIEEVSITMYYINDKQMEGLEAMNITLEHNCEQNKMKEYYYDL